MASSSSSSSDSETEQSHASAKKLFGRQRPLYDVFGRGQMADVLLWRKKKVSAGLMVGLTILWLLFEVAEYNFVTLLCHISITTLLFFFIWCSGSDLFKWAPPKVPEIILKETTFREMAFTFHRRVNQFISNLFYIACGRDLPAFFLAIISLYILSVIGTYVSFINLLYFGFLGLSVLPFLYERYENEVDYFAGKMTRKMRKSFRKFDSKLLNKIPRGPVKEKKAR